MILSKKTLGMIAEARKKGGDLATIYAIVKPEVKEYLEEGFSLKSVFDLVSDELRLNGVKEKDFRLFKKTIKEDSDELLSILDEDDGEEKSYKVISVLNFKGGVGKSTIANILDYPESVVINLDTQDAEYINAGERTINYYSVKEEKGTELKELIEELGKEYGYKYIFLDLPGMDASFLSIIQEAILFSDYFLVVTVPNMRDYIKTYNTLMEIMRLAPGKKIAIIFNKITDERDMARTKDEFEELKNLSPSIWDEPLYLSFTKAIPTMEEQKENIYNLANKNAFYRNVYSKALMQISALKKKVKEFIEE